MTLMSLNTIISTVGSIFAFRDKKSGDIVINAAPMLAAVGVASIVGCTMSDEPFSQCVEVSLGAITRMFGV